MLSFKPKLYEIVKIEAKLFFESFSSKISSVLFASFSSISKISTGLKPAINRCEPRCETPQLSNIQTFRSFSRLSKDLINWSADKLISRT